VIITLTPGEFILTRPKIQVKPARRQYSVNESYSPTWDPRIKEFVQNKKNQDTPIPQRQVSSRVGLLR
jgi:fructose-1,6-bisphosphatase